MRCSPTFVAMMNQKRISVIAGISLLTMAVAAGFGYGYAFESLQGGVTLSKFNHTDRLLKTTIASFIIILILDIIVAGALYALFKRANVLLSSITAWLRLIYSAILAKAILYLVSAMPLLNGGRQNTNLLMNKLDSFLNVWSWGLIIFGAHLLFLGILLKRLVSAPKVLVFLLQFAGVCYMVTNIAHQLWPGYELYRNKVDMVLALPMALGELVLAIWLIRMGQKKEAGTY
jgi:Domain of unknown function (DUF4386)